MSLKIRLMPDLFLVLTSFLVAIPSAAALASLTSGSGRISPAVTGWPMIALLGLFGTVQAATYLPKPGIGTFGVILLTFYVVITALVVFAAVAAAKARIAAGTRNPISVELMIMSAAITPLLAAICAWAGRVNSYVAMLAFVLPMFAILARLHHAHQHKMTAIAAGATAFVAVATPIRAAALSAVLENDLINQTSRSATETLLYTLATHLDTVTTIVATIASILVAVAIIAHIRRTQKRPTITPMWATAAGLILVAAILKALQFTSWIEVQFGIEMSYIFSQAPTTIFAVATILITTAWILHDIRRTQFESSSCSS